ncbi:MAG: DUF4386 domain-containing protein [Lysobacteraceae bacterium]
MSQKRDRLAGLLYLVVVLTGIFSLAYVPSKVSLAASPDVLLTNLANSESLFRLGIASFALEQIAFLLLPLVLYGYFRDVNAMAATLMVLFAWIGVPLAFVALAHRMDLLAVLDATSVDTLADTSLQHAAVSHAVSAYRNTMAMTTVFWGLWLAPFGYLVFVSGRLPRLLGVLLVAGCAGYLIDFFGSVVFPAYPESWLASRVLLPAAVGEIGTCLWLLIRGYPRPA